MWIMGNGFPREIRRMGLGEAALWISSPLGKVAQAASKRALDLGDMIIKAR